MSNSIRIDHRLIGTEHSCYIIAEAGVNHNGSLDIAKEMIEVAEKAGADAIKFQSFITEDLITKEAPKTSYMLETTQANESQFRMLKGLELSFEDHADLINFCASTGITYLCTPYEKRSVDMLDEIDVPAYKIASTDTNNIPFLKYIASKGRPIILSTGMSSFGEIEQAINTIQEVGDSNSIVILHCTSEYPTPFEDVNLRAIDTLKKAFGIPVGYSDHTRGIDASQWAVVLGADMIEKHFTLDRSFEGPDHSASIEPDEFKLMVNKIRLVELALGSGVKRVMPSEKSNKSKLQKSLVAQNFILAGEEFTDLNITCKRPGTGLPPSWQERVIGNKAKTDINIDEIITLSKIDWS